MHLLSRAFVSHSAHELERSGVRGSRVRGFGGSRVRKFAGSGFARSRVRRFGGSEFGGSGFGSGFGVRRGTTNFDPRKREPTRTVTPTVDYRLSTESPVCLREIPRPSA